jgi:hypothetical protein
MARSAPPPAKLGKKMLIKGLLTMLSVNIEFQVFTQRAKNLSPVV